MFRRQYTIAWSMIAIAVIAYFCAFPELAVLVGIFASAVLFVSPIALLIYLACRSAFQGSAGESPPLSHSAETVAKADAGSRTEPNPGQDPAENNSPTCRGDQRPGSFVPPTHRSFGLAGSP